MIAGAWSSADLEPRIPVGIRCTELQVETGNEPGRIREALRTSPQQWAPLWAIIHESQSISLKRPLVVRVYSEGGFVFAENESLSIFGSGTSLDEAMTDFVQHVTHFYQYYRKLPANKAIGEALRLKKLFAELFAEE